MPKRVTIKIGAEIDDGESAGYAAMTADEAREAEALEWSEGLIGDVASTPARRGGRLVSARFGH